MNRVGDHIRRLRKSLGLTQIEFSKQIGISQGTLSDIEQGNCNPSVETVLSIHERYGVTLHWILKGSEEERSMEYELKDRVRVEHELFEIIKLLPHEALTEVHDYAVYKLKKQHKESQTPS